MTSFSRNLRFHATQSLKLSSQFKACLKHSTNTLTFLIIKNKPEKNKIRNFFVQKMLRTLFVSEFVLLPLRDFRRDSRSVSSRGNGFLHATLTTVLFWWVIEQQLNCILKSYFSQYILLFKGHYISNRFEHRYIC